MSVSEGSPGRPADWAFCSVVNDEFVPGFITMYRSFESFHPQDPAPFYVLHHDLYCPLSRRGARLIGKYCRHAVFRHAQMEPFSGLVQQAISCFRTPRRLRAAFLILDAFHIEAHEKLIAIDSDVLFLGPIDEIKQLDIGFGAVRAEHPETKDPVAYVNTGLVVLGRRYRRPDIVERFKAGLRTRPYIRATGRADQALLNLAFGNDDVEYLPATFNLTKRSALRLLPKHRPLGADEVTAALHDRDVRVLHFVAEKPWARKRRESEKRYDVIEALWAEKFNAFAGPDLVEFTAALQRPKSTIRRLMTASPPSHDLRLQRLAKVRDRVLAAARRASRLGRPL